MDGRSEASDTLGNLRDVEIRQAPVPLAHQKSTSTAGSGSRRSALKASTSNASSTTLRRPKPAILSWDDKRFSKRSSTHTGTRTFYNEDTPPPSPSDIRSNTSTVPPGPLIGGELIVGDLGYHTKPTPKLDSVYDYRYDHVAPPAPIPPRLIFGLRRRIFWTVFGLILLLIVAVAVGVGVGVGVTSNNKKSEQDNTTSGDAESSHNESSTQPTDTAAPSPTETSTSTTTSSLPVSTGSSSACPAANNTIYEVPKTTMSFLRLCGVEYPGDKGTKDITVVWTASMEDCMTNCAGFTGCTACSWGAIEGDEGDNHRCYLKKNLGEQTKTRSGWEFAIMQ